MISLEDIRGLAQLVRLKLTGAEEESLRTDISNILDYVGQINAVSGDAVQSVPPLHNAVRADEPYKSGAMLLGKREALLKAFPEAKDDYLVVRKIVQRDE